MTGSIHVEGERRLEMELLDVLPADDPRARRSRRDLRRVNRFMGNAGILAELIVTPPASGVELGAGDGTLMLEVARRLGDYHAGTKLLLVDRQDLLTSATRESFAVCRWNVSSVTADVFTWLRTAKPVDLIVCNLFLHHFRGEQLRELFELASQRSGSFVACEPRRFRFPRLAGELIWLIGGSAITRHDAVASIRAGFQGQELSPLWPKGGEWDLREQRAGFFSHAFVARRR